MKEAYNIYDIDGDILHKSGENEELTIEEAQKRLENYQEKLKGLKEGDTKASVYNTYINNLQMYITNKYLSDPELLKSVLNRHLTTEEEIKETLNNLKESINDDGTTEDSTEDDIQGATTDDNESKSDEKSGDDTPVEREESSIHEERTVSQSDLLVERSGVNTEMEEYAEFEEV